MRGCSTKVLDRLVLSPSSLPLFELQGVKVSLQTNTSTVSFPACRMQQDPPLELFLQAQPELQLRTNMPEVVAK